MNTTFNGKVCDTYMKYLNSFTGLIGKTPLLKLGSLSGDANLFAKCEFMNPINIKDRVVFNVIKQAENKGLIKPGGTLIETRITLMRIT